MGSAGADKQFYTPEALNTFKSLGLDIGDDAQPQQTSLQNPDQAAQPPGKLKSRQAAPAAQPATSGTAMSQQDQARAILRARGVPGY
jgi:hypothetical protein